MNDHKLAFSIPEAVKASGFSRSILYQEMKAGKLRAVKRGRRRAILAVDLTAWLSSLPAAESDKRAAA